MQITKLVIENFRSYEGYNEIDLSVKSGKPLVVVLGDNGSGKTTILQAVKWCFYGYSVSNGKIEDVVSHMNESARFRREDMKVQITMKLGDKTWNISRSLCLMQDGDPSEPYHYFEDPPEVSIDGSIQNAFEAIESIIPRNASQFFFFDAEKIDIYTREAHTRPVKEAIGLVLNLPMITNATEDLRAAITQLDKQKVKLGRKQKKSQDLVDQLERTIEIIDKLQKKINNNKIKIGRIRKEADEKEKILLRYGNMQKLIDDLNENKLEIEQQKSKITEASNNLEKAIRKAPLVLLEKELKESVKYFKSVIAKKGRRKTKTGADQKSMGLLESIEDADMCVCLRPINDEVRSTIKAEVEKYRIKLKEEIAAPFPAEMHLFVEYGEILLAEAKDVANTVSGAVSKIAAEKSKLNTLEEEKRKKQSKIGDRNTEEYSVIAERYTALVRDILPPIEKALEDDEKVLDNKEDYKEELSKKISSKTSVEGSKELELMEDRARKALRAIRAKENDFIDYMRDRVQKEATVHFKSMTNMPNVFKGVTVGENFQLDLLDREGKSFRGYKGSQGQKEVLALAFMAGLAKASGSDSPFIMDSALQRFDTRHKQNILRTLTRISEQVILLVLPDEELSKQDLESIRPYISKEIRLEFSEEKRHTSVEVVD